MSAQLKRSVRFQEYFLLKKSEEELVKLVQRIIEHDGTEEEVNQMMSLLESNVPHPEVSDLIYWNKDGDLTAEEVVRRALAYEPIRLQPSSLVVGDQD